MESLHIEEGGYFLSQELKRADNLMYRRNNAVLPPSEEDAAIIAERNRLLREYDKKAEQAEDRAQNNQETQDAYDSIGYGRWNGPRKHYGAESIPEPEELPPLPEEKEDTEARAKARAQLNELYDSTTWFSVKSRIDDSSEPKDEYLKALEQEIGLSLSGEGMEQVTVQEIQKRIDVAVLDAVTMLKHCDKRRTGGKDESHLSKLVEFAAKNCNSEEARRFASKALGHSDLKIWMREYPIVVATIASGVAGISAVVAYAIAEQMKQ